MRLLDRSERKKIQGLWKSKRVHLRDSQMVGAGRLAN